MAKQFPNVNCQRGAPHGRMELRDYEGEKARCFKVKLDQGYDDGNAYWGNRINGESLYCMWSENVMMFEDAGSRHEAKIKFEKRFPKINWVN